MMDAFTIAYVEAALWSSTDDKDVPLDKNYGIDDIHPDTLAEMIEDCRAFQSANEEVITEEHYQGSSKYSTDEMAGHLFWLDRNGHGRTFRDGDWDDEAETKLSESSDGFGEVNLYVGDDGKIYC